MVRKVPIYASILSVLSLRLQPCFAFHVTKEVGGGSHRSRSSSAGTTVKSSSVAEESPPEMRLNADAIRLKNDIIELAEKTRRGVSD
jgi:hypothetical protein